MDDDEIHVTTTEARGGTRGTPVGVILIASLVLVIVAFAIIWFAGGITI